MTALLRSFVCLDLNNIRLVQTIEDVFGRTLEQFCNILGDAFVLNFALKKGAGKQTEH